VITVESLAAGASATVEFAWAPPAPGSSLLGSSHFCLLARVENPGDPAALGTGGGAAVKGSNNLAQRNVHVVAAAPVPPPPPMPPPPSPPPPSPPPPGGEEPERAGIERTERPTVKHVVEWPFFVGGFATPRGFKTASSLTLWRDNVNGEIELTLPADALDWRDAQARIARSTARIRRRRDWREYLGRPRFELKDDDVNRVVGVSGASRLRVKDGLATITLDRRSDRMTISRLFATGPRAIARVRVVDPVVGPEKGFIRVSQSLIGAPRGGVTLELRPVSK
jgi:hypothetical protein